MNVLTRNVLFEKTNIYVYKCGNSKFNYCGGEHEINFDVLCMHLFSMPRVIKIGFKTKGNYISINTR